MNLIAVGDQKTALSLLKNLGLAENSRDLAALKLLNFYLQSQNADYSEVQKKEWLNLKNISPAALEKINDPFFCLVYGKIAMALEKQKRYMEAFESYSQAYAFLHQLRPSNASTPDKSHRPLPPELSYQ